MNELDTQAGQEVTIIRTPDGPQWHTFTQIDPSGTENGSHRYAAANPINNTDPTGLLSGELICNIIFGVVSAIMSGGFAALVGVALSAGLLAGTLVGIGVGIFMVGVAAYMCHDLEG